MKMRDEMRTLSTRYILNYKSWSLLTHNPSRYIERSVENAVSPANSREERRVTQLTTQFINSSIHHSSILL